MPYIPPQGTPGVRDNRNPTLIPNFDKPVSSGNGVLGLQSPADFLVSNPRVDALGTIAVGGTITNGDTVLLSVALATLPGGTLVVPYPVITSDTTITVAEGIADAINSSSTLQNVGIFAEMGGTTLAAEVIVHANGPIGNMVTLTGTVNGAGSETLTIGNSGVLAGGSGPVFATNNFNFNCNGSTESFFYGQPYLLGYDVLTQLVNQGMPVE